MLSSADGGAAVVKACVDGFGMPSRCGTATVALILSLLKFPVAFDGNCSIDDNIVM